MFPLPLKQTEAINMSIQVGKHVFLYVSTYLCIYICINMSKRGERARERGSEGERGGEAVLLAAARYRHSAGEEAGLDDPRMETQKKLTN